jgi:hypothetical protein
MTTMVRVFTAWWSRESTQNELTSTSLLERDGEGERVGRGGDSDTKAPEHT